MLYQKYQVLGMRNEKQWLDFSFCDLQFFERGRRQAKLIPIDVTAFSTVSFPQLLSSIRYKLIIFDTSNGFVISQNYEHDFKTEVILNKTSIDSTAPLFRHEELAFLASPEPCPPRLYAKLKRICGNRKGLQFDA